MTLPQGFMPGNSEVLIRLELDGGPIMGTVTYAHSQMLSISLNA